MEQVFGEDVLCPLSRPRLDWFRFATVFLPFLNPGLAKIEPMYLNSRELITYQAEADIGRLRDELKSVMAQLGAR